MLRTENGSKGNLLTGIIGGKRKMVEVYLGVIFMALVFMGFVGLIELIWIVLVEDSRNDDEWF